ncbi:unnamed protein product [Ectocarpus sp. 6 AP-2014]
MHCCEREVDGSLSINRCRSTAVDGSPLDALGRFSSGGPCYYAISSPSMPRRFRRSLFSHTSSNQTIRCSARRRKKNSSLLHGRDGVLCASASVARIRGREEEEEEESTVWLPSTGLLLRSLSLYA